MHLQGRVFFFIHLLCICTVFPMTQCTVMTNVLLSCKIKVPFLNVWFLLQYFCHRGKKGSASQTSPHSRFHSHSVISVYCNLMNTPTSVLDHLTQIMLNIQIIQHTPFIYVI